MHCHGRLRGAERGTERLLLPRHEPMRRDKQGERRQVLHDRLPAGSAAVSAAGIAAAALASLSAAALALAALTLAATPLALATAPLALAALALATTTCRSGLLCPGRRWKPLVRPHAPWASGLRRSHRGAIRGGPRRY